MVKLQSRIVCNKKCAVPSRFISAFNTYAPSVGHITLKARAYNNFINAYRCAIMINVRMQVSRIDSYIINERRQPTAQCSIIN